MIICWKSRDLSRSRWQSSLLPTRGGRLCPGAGQAARKVHKVASGVMALAGMSVVAVGGYALFVQLSANALTPSTATTTEAVREPAAIVATGPAEEEAASVSAAPQEHPGAPTSPPRRLCRQPRPRRVTRDHRPATPRSTPRNSLPPTLIAASFFITCANSRTPLLNLLRRSALMERAALSGRRRHKAAHANAIDGPISGRHTPRSPATRW